jgi:hypothetical protein
MTTIESAATTIREPVAGFEFDEAQLAAARSTDHRQSVSQNMRRRSRRQASPNSGSVIDVVETFPSADDTP